MGLDRGSSSFDNNILAWRKENDKSTTRQSLYHRRKFAQVPVFIFLQLQALGNICKNFCSMLIVHYKEKLLYHKKIHLCKNTLTDEFHEHYDLLIET